MFHILDKIRGWGARVPIHNVFPISSWLVSRAISHWLHVSQANSQPPDFRGNFTVHLPTRHKCCVNLTGRSWRTWKWNRLPPKYLLCAKMYLVALGFEVDSESHETQIITFYTQNPWTFLICCREFEDNGILKPTAVIEDHPAQDPGRPAPVLSILLQRNKLFNHIDDGMHWVGLRWVPGTVTCSEACSHGLLSFIISLHMLMNGVH